MAKIPTQKRISEEDFQDQKKWIGKLLNPLNTFMEQMSDALNNGLTVGENMDAVFRTIEFTSYPYSFKWDRKNRPASIVVGACNQVLTDAPYVNWSFDSGTGTIKVASVTGITPTPASKYRLTLTIYTG